MGEPGLEALRLTLFKDRAMAEAARDEAYLATLREVSEEWADVDSEGLPDH